MSPTPIVHSFSEQTSSEIFARRLSSLSKDQPLPAVLSAIVTHLHDIIKDLRPTPADWRNVIAFLTEVGHASDERRQEWVLLSDLLGASALVDEINTIRPKGATPNTVRGPFYRADAPQMVSGATISRDGIGEPLMVCCRVVDLDGNAVAGARVATWQANAHGFYENQQPDQQPEFNLRGVFLTDSDGRFDYRTIRPAGYGVPDDGPVGSLLRKAGYPMRRPAHLHFMITASGFEALTTHVYDASDPHLGEDAIFGVKQALVRNFECKTVDGARVWSLAFTFVMARARPGVST